jgi:Arc/MetJ family transcription regulator
MQTNVELDDTLVRAAMQISGINTTKDILHMLLKEYIRKNNMKQILKYRGSNIWEGDLEEMRTGGTCTCMKP